LFLLLLCFQSIIYFILPNDILKLGLIWVSVLHERMQYVDYKRVKLARALAWHARGRRFDSDILHQISEHNPLFFKGFCV